MIVYTVAKVLRQLVVESVTVGIVEPMLVIASVLTISFPLHSYECVFVVLRMFCLSFHVLLSNRRGPYLPFLPLLSKWQWQPENQ